MGEGTRETWVERGERTVMLWGSQRMSQNNMRVNFRMSNKVEL